MMKLLLLLAALNGALAVMLGAFGAHGLKHRVDDAALAIWATASQYHFIHVLALLAVVLLAKSFQLPALLTAGWLLLVGTLIFSGSLYVLVLSGMKWLGAVTPLGGGIMILGWLWMAVVLAKQL